MIHRDGAGTGAVTAKRRMVNEVQTGGGILITRDHARDARSRVVKYFSQIAEVIARHTTAKAKGLQKFSVNHRAKRGLLSGFRQSI